eukprot:TRINITY_DN486_c0_g1_i3.p1 TRINITY_DN486_c0_g1~~TRINITY_DN486_c0_g1_i3.p1  ORF type:complete len:103 (+),score=0.21 TRINITY_DN486_c0_g1_i3:290-598(+)
MHELIMVPQPGKMMLTMRRMIPQGDFTETTPLTMSSHIDICLLIFISRTTLPLYQLGHFKGNYMIFLIISIVLLEGRRARKDGEIGIKRRVEGEEADSDRNA